MNASEILTNAKAYTALKSLQMLDRLAAQAFASAMSYRGTAYDGTLINNTNAEAQAEHRENELTAAINAQAAFWKMNPNEVRALAMGEHAILH
jgi:hypothetical protein